MRWTDPAGWHLTLAFLGSTDPFAVDGLATGLASAVAGHTGFSVTTGGLGAFPRAGAARVLWYGIDPDPRLGALAADVAAALGVADDRPFAPHLTLARARDRGTDLAGWLAGRDTPTGRIAVEEVRLYRSHLGRGPARYETLSSVPLRATAGVPA